MTPQEQELLLQLTERINQTQLPEKDPDAQNLLGRELDANPDALYIMAQTLLVQNMALEQLKVQAAQLRQQLQQAQQPPAHTTSFLGRLLGDHDQPQPAPPPLQQVRPPQQFQPAQALQQGWQPVPNYQQAPAPQYPPPQYAQPQYAAAAPGQPSFLRGAMQTAAGVAAGALIFEGVESLMHPYGHGGFGGFERPVEETVINNYYDQPGPKGSGDSHVNDQLERDFGGEYHGREAAHDAAQFDRGAQFSNADLSGSGAGRSAGSFDQGAYDHGMDNDSVTADNSLDNMQIDDSGSGFDDGGGFDSGSFDGDGGSDNSGGF